MKKDPHAEVRFTLHPDRNGMVWDLLLYIPTITVLAIIGLNLWYGPNHEWAYLFVFLASFFLIAGANRILKTRLMLLPGAPVALDITPARVRLETLQGQPVDLVKDLRFFADAAGKSFGLSGCDVLDRRLQYVFHRGQFKNGGFERVIAILKVYRTI